MAQPYVGEIRLVGFNFAPNGWSFCDGSPRDISEFAPLFTLIGTTYGGDGQTTFNLPNLLGRVPIHWGTAVSGAKYVTGQSSGSETVSLVTNELPQHTHPVYGSSATATTPTPVVQSLPGVTTANLYSTPATTVNMTATLSAGGSQPHENIQPYLCVNYIIALYGVFPQQS